ncbi:MAG: translation initiation factor IF-2 [Candidatus Bilamarchaeaceae archaeon]
MQIRSPIVVVMGHVDHGKTTILDAIRGTAVARKEAGGITQMIGASYIKKESIEEMAKVLKGRFNFVLKIPGLLLIDTPGHEAFTNLRDRGGSIADIAILVVDIMQGFQPQTVESIRILKQYRTPFVVAANKVDLISGWKESDTPSFLEALSRQPPHVSERVDEKIYGLIGNLSEFGFDSERFDRIADFRKQIAIVPVSAKTKEGLSELLMLIAGLSQKFLEGNLEINENGVAKGSIIEVKEEKGLGATIDVILYDGVLKKGDEILFLSQEGPKRTKVRALLEPNIVGGKERYTQLEQVAAAAGVKILAPDLENAIPGSPIETVTDFVEREKHFESIYKNIVIARNETGLVLKADSLGSLEALVRLLEENKIPIKEAGIGKVTKKDVLAAEAVSKENKYLGVVLGFNVSMTEDGMREASDKNVPVILSDVIYRALENYGEWVRAKIEVERTEIWKRLIWPAEIVVLSGCCFRVSKPAIFGIKVLGGVIRPGYKLMDGDGNIVGEIREIQHEKNKIDKATTGMDVAISCEGTVFGKDVCEEDRLYTYIPPEDILEWEKHKTILSKDDLALFEKIKKAIVKTPW